MRRVIASRLSASKAEVPHAYYRADADLTALTRLRASLKKKGSGSGNKPPSVNDFVIAAAARGRQCGFRLYEDLCVTARATGVGIVTCEYDIDPPNDASRRFHDRFGFREVGTQRVAGGTKAVSLQELTL